MFYRSLKNYYKSFPRTNYKEGHVLCIVNYTHY